MARVGVKWTPKTGPVVKLRICGSDRGRKDQTYECKNEAKETQRSLQSEGGHGGPDGHQNGGSDCAGAQRAPGAGKPVEDGHPG